MVDYLVDLYRMQIGSDLAKNAVVIAFALFMLLGIGVLIYSIHLTIKLKHAASWPVANGVVVESGVYSITKNDPGDRPRTLHAAEVCFEYVVDGVKYVSDKIHWGAVRVALNFGNYVQNKLTKYPVGKEIQVHYNPVKPSDCVVELNFGLEMAVPFIFGIFGFLLAGTFLFAFIAPVALKPLPVAYLFALICFVVFLKFNVPLYRADAEKRGWKSMYGVLQSTAIQIDNPKNVPLTEDAQVYYVQAAYAYDADQKEYFGTGRVGLVFTREYAEKKKSKLAIGKKFRILVNPSSPSESMLNPSGLVGAIFLTVVLSLFMIITPIAATRTCMAQLHNTTYQGNTNGNK